MMSALETLIEARSSAVVYAMTDELPLILRALGVAEAIDARSEVIGDVPGREPVVLLAPERMNARFMGLVTALVRAERAVAVLTTARSVPEELAAVCAFEIPADSVKA